VAPETQLKGFRIARRFFVILGVILGVLAVIVLYALQH
jgi:hypothetical protein